MPIPFSTVKQAIDEFDDSAFKTKVISEVDAALQDTTTLRWRFAQRVDEERFKFVVEECWLSLTSKRDIEKRYKDVGWGGCVVTNSFEERMAPGSVVVILSARRVEPRRPTGTT